MMKNYSKQRKHHTQGVRRILACTVLACMLGCLAVDVSAAPQKHGFHFEDKGYRLVMDGDPEKVPIPEDYKGIAGSYVGRSPYTDPYCKALLCDLDGNGTEELMVFHGIEQSEDDSIPQMGASVFTMKNGGWPQSLIEDYPLMNMVGDCNGEIQILEQGGHLYLVLHSYGNPGDLQTGTWELYTVAGESCQRLLSVEYTWKGTELSYGFYETQYDKCKATVNGKAWDYRDFEQLQAQMHTIYRSQIFGYDTNDMFDFGEESKAIQDAWQIKTKIGW